MDALKENSLPKIGSVWLHKKGKFYIVLAVSNVIKTSDKFPITVLYMDEKGEEYSTPLTRWNAGSFRLVGDINIIESFVQIKEGIKIIMNRLKTDEEIKRIMGKVKLQKDKYNERGTFDAVI